MSYQFSLQKLLDLKEKEKEQLQSSLSSSVKKLEDEKIVQSGLLQRQNELQTQLIRKQEESTNISVLVGLHTYQKRLEQKIVQSSQRVVKAEKDVDRKMQQVVDKSKEAKTFHLLKDRERLRFQYEQDRIEQNQLDEISVNLFLRGNQSKQE